MKLKSILIFILFLTSLILIIGAIYFFNNNWLKSKYFEEENRSEEKTENKVVENTLLPKSFILDIPFVTQAPFRSWEEYPFNHTCEEASVLQIYYYFERKQVKEDEVYEKLLDLVDFEIKNYGFHEDTSAAQTAKLIEDYYDYKTKVVYDISLEDIKKEIAQGNPVIIPTAGRLLNNPHFTPPGPFYHMLVIKGYNQEGFITNDVGTYKTGENWLYSYQILEKAIHDWNDGDVLNGKSAIIVVYPPNSFFYLKDLKEFRNNLILEGKNFLEANLNEMKIKIYKKGFLEKELPIFTRGNPERWGGTSLGLYQVLSKNKLAYSVLADSYMPWSLHIYGKYYIHGDNYYPNTGIDTSPITGGCLRLNNENAKIVYGLTEVGMPVLVTDKGFENDDYKYSAKNIKELPELSAKSYLVADLDSGFILAEKKSQEQLPIASLTKLMTATIVAEKTDLRKSILVTPEMLKAYGSTEGLVTGANFYAFELFYPLLIESSNDAAEVLSYFLGREKTIRLMNEKTKAILMENTEFVDPSGISSRNISTAEDLFYLARYILNARPMFLKISKGEEIWTFGLQNSFKNLENKNIFFEDPNFVGGKIGYIKASQSTGVFIFSFPLKDGEERRIAIILLNSEAVNGFPVNLEKDVEIILNWLKENYWPLKF